MKIEYLENSSEDCPLIRIYGKETTAMLTLIDALKELSQNKDKTIALHELPGIESVEGCCLIACDGSVNEGIKKTENDNEFTLTLTSEKWQKVAELAQQVCNSIEKERYQWLDDTSDISLLLSSSEKGYW